MSEKPEYDWLEEAAKNPDWKWANLRAMQYLTNMHSDKYHIMSRALHLRSKPFHAETMAERFVDVIQKTLASRKTNEVAKIEVQSGKNNDIIAR